MFLGYTSLNLKEVPSTGKSSPSHLDANVLSFFTALDEDNSKTLDFEELQNFFYWSKWKIAYAPYAEENQIMKVLADPNYWGTPALMRIKIIANDEDMGMLYATFLNYYGVDAHVASLISNSEKVQDHLVSIVRISETLEVFNEKVGGVPF